MGKRSGEAAWLPSNKAPRINFIGGMMVWAVKVSKNTYIIAGTPDSQYVLWIVWERPYLLS